MKASRGSDQPQKLLSNRRILMDKTSKIIFALIAAGLWFNSAANLLRPAYAQQDALHDINVSVR